MCVGMAVIFWVLLRMDNTNYLLRGWRESLAGDNAVVAGVAPVAGAGEAAGADEGALGFVKAGLPVRWGVGMGAFRAGLGGCREILI